MVTEGLTSVPKCSFAGEASSKPSVEGFTGNMAGAYIGYACSENAFIYPITPSTPMAEY